MMFLFIGVLVFLLATGKLNIPGLSQIGTPSNQGSGLQVAPGFRNPALVGGTPLLTRVGVTAGAAALKAATAAKTTGGTPPSPPMIPLGSSGSGGGGSYGANTSPAPTPLPGPAGLSLGSMMACMTIDPLTGMLYACENCCQKREPCPAPGGSCCGTPYTPPACGATGACYCAQVCMPGYCGPAPVCVPCCC
jgi:hypothetical protein